MIQYLTRMSDGQADRSLLSRCTEQLHNVHNSRMEKLGKQHPDTMLTEQALNACSLLWKYRSSSLVKTYSSWADLSLALYPEANTYFHFKEMRQRIRSYGV